MVRPGPLDWITLTGRKMEEALKLGRREAGEEGELGGLLAASLEKLQEMELEPTSRGSSCPWERLRGKYPLLGPQAEATDGQRGPEEGLPGKQGSGRELGSMGDGIPAPQKVLFPAERLSMKWEQMYPVGAGLHNVGNTCFLNAGLQCLTHTPPLANYLLSREHSQTCQRRGFCMLCVMEKHTIQAFSSSGTAIKPVSVIQSLKRIAEYIQFGTQGDAHYFLRCTLDAMQKACLNGSSRLDRQTQATTLVHQIFGGYLRSRVKCSLCKGVSDTYDPYLDLTLEIEQAANLEQALEQFVRPAVLRGENAYTCAKCKHEVSGSEGVTIHRASNILVLKLKRVAGGGKITKNVPYPQLLNVRPYMSQENGDPVVYGLYAVLVHAGTSSQSGHYYCHVKASNGQWYQMDDDLVRPSNISVVLAQQAYLLFYRRIPSPKKSPEGPMAKAASSRPGRTGAVCGRVRKTVSSPLLGPRPGVLPGRKLPGLEEVGGPVARGTFGMGTKLPNSTAPLKRPAESPWPKLPLPAGPGTRPAAPQNFGRHLMPSELGLVSGASVEPALGILRSRRWAVNSFSNGTGYTKRRSAQIREPQQQPPPLPPPPPPLLAVTPPAALPILLEQMIGKFHTVILGQLQGWRSRLSRRIRRSSTPPLCRQMQWMVQEISSDGSFMCGLPAQIQQRLQP
ncbi:ubiquitin carboxyl-terminal hydrolase 36-like [Chlamydotis macqueenii]